jgi:hypothetical protein
MRKMRRMATIHEEIRIEAPLSHAWSALRDVGALHTRLVPGFVTGVELEEGARVVTFGNGMVAREIIVTVDDEAHRLVWSIVGGKMTHHNASAQVFEETPGVTRFVWIADLLSNELGPTIGAMMKQAMPIIKRTLEASAKEGPRPGA